MTSSHGSAIEGRLTHRVLGPVWRRARPALRLVQVRLRIPIVLVVAALVVGRWDVTRNYWDRLSRRPAAESLGDRAVSTDTEYFCPMDPGVVSDWPGKCGICNMGLVRRKRGEAVALPDGVVARMQLSPYRIQLAGIQTAPAAFRPLLREFESAGVVARAQNDVMVRLDVPARQVPWISEGQAVEVACSDLPGRDPFSGSIRSVVQESDEGWECLHIAIAIKDAPRELRAGSIALVRFHVALATLEPFRSLPFDPPPLAAGEPRQLYACPDHSDVLVLQPSRCPIDGNQRDARPLAEHQRVRYWCPMHPDVTATGPGARCRACGDMELRVRVVSFNPRGQVLAVPQSAVVDTGIRKVVFVESMPGMFDGVEVVVGPRSGDFYPVVRGLEEGQKVATAGAFLLDAETRLNPSVASAYFGAARAEQAAAPSTRLSRPAPGRTAAAALEGLSPEDRALADRQKLCPVTSKPLGSMGAPVRLTISGRTIFLCCDGCQETFTKDPEKYLAKLAGAKRP